MPQPPHITKLRDADLSSLDEDLQAYFTKCEEKLGLIPNVLKAYALRPEKLRTFAKMYNELMLGESQLTKLEREMVAVPSHRRLAGASTGHVGLRLEADVNAGANRGLRPSYSKRERAVR